MSGHYSQPWPYSDNLRPQPDAVADGEAIEHKVASDLDLDDAVFLADRYGAATPGAQPPEEGLPTLGELLGWPE